MTTDEVAEDPFGGIEPDDRILTETEYDCLEQMVGLDEELTEFIEMLIASEANDMGAAEVRAALEGAAGGLKNRLRYPDAEYDFELKHVTLRLLRFCTDLREETGLDWATIHEGVQLAGESILQNQREEYGKKQGRKAVYDEIEAEYDGDVESWWEDHSDESVWDGR